MKLYVSIFVLQCAKTWLLTNFVEVYFSRFWLNEDSTINSQNLFKFEMKIFFYGLTNDIEQHNVHHLNQKCYYCPV